MLAYRHAFHAGNHADVLKHAVLVAVLRHLSLKPAAWRLVDTHAGAGAYLLDSEQARKLGEHEQGIGRLMSADALPELLDDYRQQVLACNPDGVLRAYPGSPRLVRRLMRPQDQLRLYELHPADHALLAEGFAQDRQAQVVHGDGFAGIKAQLPPPSRRGVLLIDPSYEIRTDYAAVVKAVDEALSRFAQCVVLVWYPDLDSRDSAQLPRQLKSLVQARASEKEKAVRGWLHAALRVAPPNDRGFGLLGSGVFVVNPPHTLKPLLQKALPVLAPLLAQMPSPVWRLETSDGT